MNVTDMVRIFMVFPSGYSVLAYVPPDADALDQAKCIVTNAAPRYASVGCVQVVEGSRLLQP